jgi:hypothetical protein
VCTFKGWLNKLDWPWVSGHNGVGGEQRDPLRAGLRYQDAIEGSLWMGGKLSTKTACAPVMANSL